MSSKLLYFAFAFLLAFTFTGSPVHAAEGIRDIVIYGGSSGGVTAAIQAKRMGKTVVLIEPTEFIGGLTTGGLGATDIGNKKAIGGLSREFYSRVFDYYTNPAHWKQETRDEYFTREVRSSAANADTMWTFEPHAASEIYDHMLKEAGVEVVFGERLDLDKGVVKEGARIVKIIMESGREFPGRMFIDATYEGDLMANSGVSYHVGREPNSQYGETLNGVQTGRAVYHQFTENVDPYIVPGDPSSGVLPGIGADGPGEEFSGDKKVQAYNFRMCTTDVAENRLAWTKPENYDPQWYELLLRNFEAGDHRVPWAPKWMPNRKTDTNNNFAISTDFIGQNWDYPEADYATRAKIVQAHEDWQKGLMWTMAHSPRVPEKVRAQIQRLGLAKDEFTENDNWPRQLYIRESRRMISDYVMTEKNCKRQEIVEDSVGMGAYNMDSHHVQRYINEEGFVRNEGDVQVGTRPYPVSYRSIRPKESECVNLLVPVCLSASHISYGSIRMEPVFMVMGQSAATAAAHAIDQGVNVQRISYDKLKAQLLEDGQVLDFESPPIPPRVSLTKEQLGGIVVDDTEAERQGFDAVGSTVSPFVQGGYRHDADADKGSQSARFQPEIPRAGKYQVSIAYTAMGNRATNVPVRIQHAEGSVVRTVNQQKKAPVNGHLYPLGVFYFDAGTKGFVEITNEATNGHVIIDAVQWVPVE